MERAAAGFRAHTGWAIAVTLAGPADAPSVIDRRRIEYAGRSLPRQMYHAAASLSVDRAERLVRKSAEAANTLAEQELRSLIDELRAAGYKVAGCGVVLGSGRAILSVREAVASHAARHGAEGELYRQALLEAGRACGLTVAGAAERDLYDRAGEALGMPASVARTRVAELGREIGAPWAQDQRHAAAVAWMALAASPKRRPRRRG